MVEQRPRHHFFQRATGWRIEFRLVKRLAL
jgi:hypothetical protein